MESRQNAENLWRMPVHFSLFSLSPAPNSARCVDNHWTRIRKGTTEQERGGTDLVRGIARLASGDPQRRAHARLGDTSVEGALHHGRTGGERGPIDDVRKTSGAHHRRLGYACLPIHIRLVPCLSHVPSPPNPPPMEAGPVKKPKLIVPCFPLRRRIYRTLSRAAHPHESAGVGGAVGG